MGLKSEELTNPNSCLNKMKDDQIVFVLIETDPDAPNTIRDWVRRRVMRGKNKLQDPKIQSAIQCAEEMEKRQNAQREKQPADPT